MKRTSRQPSSSSTRGQRRLRCFGSALPKQLAAGQRGFTLLELSIAMAFVVLLASGITLSISTCLNVWQRSLEAADLNQEARAVMGLVSRDLRGAYLGLDRMMGYFIGQPAADSGGDVDTLELCTESSEPAMVALLPEGLREEWAQEAHAAVSDYVVAHYHMREGGGQAPGGLYRTLWVAPLSFLEMSEQLQFPPARSELISTSVVGLRFHYFDGRGWLSAWETTAQDRRLPAAVAVELTLRDGRGNDHVYQTVVSIPAR